MQGPVKYIRALNFLREPVLVQQFQYEVILQKVQDLKDLLLKQMLKISFKIASFILSKMKLLGQLQGSFTFTL